MPDFSDEGDLSVQAKVEVRHDVLTRRRALSASDRARADERVRAELVELVRRVRPARITAYVPVGSEPGGAELPEALRAALPPDAELLLPVLLPDLDLTWARYTTHADLAPGLRGLREPAGERLGVDAVADASLVVVPALAVDHRGRRLGRGGGSYDRALARVRPGALTVALVHDGELLDRLPAEVHDRPVRAVITPSGGLVSLAASG